MFCQFLFLFCLYLYLNYFMSLALRVTDVQRWRCDRTSDFATRINLKVFMFLCLFLLLFFFLIEISSSSFSSHLYVGLYVCFIVLQLVRGSFLFSHIFLKIYKPPFAIILFETLPSENRALGPASQLWETPFVVTIRVKSSVSIHIHLGFPQI